MIKTYNHKAYADLKNGDWRVVLVKADNTVLKIMGTGLGKESIAQRVADAYNERNGH